MTDEHCAYCDATDLDATGEAQIDHFKPKSRSEFYELVCQWSNLFWVCFACNKAKLDKWEPELLRPDADDFEFERYFEYRADSGRLEPSAVASADAQHRAERTIDLLHLNRGGACEQRKNIAREMRREPMLDAKKYPYRFLIPLCA